MKIDAVIPTIGEWSLPYCVEYLRKRVPVNNLILVAPKRVEDKIGELADIFVPFDEKNIGKARAKGLELVETELYASFDSDIIVSPKWYSWCIKTIDAPRVAACQGYAKARAKTYTPWHIKFIKGGGTGNRGFCCLGNTLLKTSVVKEIGMPKIRIQEDWALRLKMEDAGYQWIANLYLVSIHLKTDIDIWKRHIWWGKMGAKIDELHGKEDELQLHQLGHHLTKNLLSYSWKENLYRATLRLCLIYGRACHYLSATKSRYFSLKKTHD